MTIPRDCRELSGTLQNPVRLFPAFSLKMRHPTNYPKSSPSQVLLFQRNGLRFSESRLGRTCALAPITLSELTPCLMQDSATALCSLLVTVLAHDLDLARSSCLSRTNAVQNSLRVLSRTRLVRRRTFLRHVQLQFLNLGPLWLCSWKDSVAPLRIQLVNSETRC